MKKKLYVVVNKGTKGFYSEYRTNNVYDRIILLINLIQDLVCDFDIFGNLELNNLDLGFEEYLKLDFKGDEEQKEKMLKLYELIKPNLLEKKEETKEVVGNVYSEK